MLEVMVDEQYIEDGNARRKDEGRLICTYLGSVSEDEDQDQRLSRSGARERYRSAPAVYNIGTRVPGGSGEIRRC